MALRKAYGHISKRATVTRDNEDSEVQTDHFT